MPITDIASKRRRVRQIHIDGLGAVNPKDLMSPPVVSYWTGHSETWLRQDRQKANPTIPFVKAGGRYLYFPADVAKVAPPAYVAAQLQLAP